MDSKENMKLREMQIRINRRIEDLKLEYSFEAEKLLTNFQKKLIDLGEKYKLKAEKILKEKA